MPGVYWLARTLDRAGRDEEAAIRYARIAETIPNRNWLLMRP
jgi:hypothetical protein